VKLRIERKKVVHLFQIPFVKKSLFLVSKYLASEKISPKCKSRLSKIFDNTFQWTKSNINRDVREIFNVIYEILNNLKRIPENFFYTFRKGHFRINPILKGCEMT
jgi:hypothetical protein